MRNDLENQTRALGRSFLYAFRGIRYCIKNERNMRIHLAAAVFVTAFSLVYRLEPLGYAVLFLAMGAVISFEAVNTALEALVNLVAAGAVFMAALAAIAAGVCLFGNWAHLWETALEILTTPLLAALFGGIIAGGIWFIFYGNKLFKD